MFENRIKSPDQLDSKLSQKRQVKLKTCADVYDYWRNFKRSYKKAPKDGVEFQIDYIDTGLALPEEARQNAPIALLLHGAPGSYHDFNLLINHLSRQNVRVIAPNFPEYTATVETKVLFRHSADEKAAYLRDFFKALNITKIDLLVSHSSAIFPTLLILLNANRDKLNSCKSSVDIETRPKVSKACNESAIVLEPVKQQQQHQPSSESDEPDEGDKFEDAREDVDDNNNNNNPLQIVRNEAKLSKKIKRKTGDVNAKRKPKRDTMTSANQEVIVKFDEPIEIKAVALLNPAGHRLPMSMKPTWFKCGSVRIYQHKIGRYWFRKLGPAFLTVVGVPVKVDNMDNVMLSATVMRNSKCTRVSKQLEQLSQLGLPTLLVFSENDKLIEKEIFYEMTRFMKLDPNNFDIFNSEGDVEVSQSHENDWIRVMVFKAGGHYAYSNYAKTVNKAVSELLQRVTSKEDNTERSVTCKLN